MADQPLMPQPRPYVVQEAAGKYFWCACGRSAKQPYCDGSHKGTSFSPIVVEFDEPKTVAYCGCKQSGNKPFCDGSHRDITAPAP